MGSTGRPCGKTARWNECVFTARHRMASKRLNLWAQLDFISIFLCLKIHYTSMGMFWDGNVFVRLGKLVRHLTAGDPLKMDSLAELIAISGRQGLRYIDELKDSGFNVPRNSKNEYRITGWPFPLEEDEQEVMNMSKQEICITSWIIKGMFFSVPGENANSRQSQLAMGRQYGEITLRRIKDIEGDNGYVGFVENLTIAINEKRTVDILDYRCGCDNHTKKYTVEPYRIIDNLKYVMVFSPVSRKSFTLKISRIGCVRIRNDPWLYEPMHSHDLGDVFGMHGPERYRIDLLLDNMSYDLLLDEYPRSEKYIVHIRDQTHLRTTVHGLKAVGRFVASLADHIEVVEGPELKAYLKEFTEKYMSKFL